MNIQEVANNYLAAKNTGITVADGKKIERKEIYINRNAKGFGKGQTQLVDSNTLEEVGITNLENKNMLPNGKEYLITGVKVLFAAEADKEVKTAKYGAVDGLPAFVNGVLRVEQDGILSTIAMTSVAVSKEQFNRNLPGEQYFKIAPIMLKSGKTFGITIECTDAISAEACFHLAFDVIEFSESAKVSAARFC